VSDNPFKFNKNKPVVIPVGGDFPPSGFIGAWTAAVMTTFMTEVDLKEEMGITTFDAMRALGASGYRRYYWHDHDAAKEAGAALKQEYGPGSVWVFECSTDTVLNFAKAETSQSFGSQITYDGCRIATLRSRKYRHELHMIALPAAVQAYARMMGWDIPEFNAIKELTSQDTVFTDAFQTRMIGDPDNPDEYEKSELWQYRQALWAALGEENPQAYQMIKEEHRRKTKYDTTSEQLNEALGVLHFSWDDPVYLRLVPVPDPRVDAVYNKDDETKRLSIPCVADIFKSKEQAETAAKADRDRMSGGGGETTTTTSSSTDANHPPYPETWGFSDEYKKEWRMIVERLKKEGLRPMVIGRLKNLSENDLQNEIAATVSDVEAWWDRV